MLAQAFAALQVMALATFSIRRRMMAALARQVNDSFWMDWGSGKAQGFKADKD